MIGPGTSAGRVIGPLAHEQATADGCASVLYA
jgi:hypothetical protein